MKPVVLGQSFAWLHEAPGRVGVVICPGIGRDLRHAYRALYALANRVQEAGYPALRLHYSNIGNSGDDCRMPAFDTWLHDVEYAFDWMRRHVGSEKVILCGFRLGALLIAHLKDRQPSASIFLEPVTSGQALLREMNAWNAMQGVSNETVEGLWENEDLRLRESDRRSIGVRSMADRDPAAPYTLIVTSAAGRGHIRQRGGLAGQEVQVVHSAFYAEVMEPYERSKIPWTDFETICAWLKHRVPPGDRPCPTQQTEFTTLIGPTWREQAVELGEGRKIRGILSEPLTRMSPSKRAVVIGNLANDPQFGVGRFALELARRLASEGLSVLRIDHLGVGDSDDLPDGRQPLTYATPRDDEFRVAIDWLEARGFTDIGLAGHCSGAYQAFRATVSDRRVRFAVLINLAVLTWTYDGSYADYLASRRPRMDAVLRLGMRLTRDLPTKLLLIRTMRDLARRRVKIWLVSGEKDHRRRDFERYFRVRNPRRAGSTTFACVTVPETDHLIRTQSMRRRVVDAVVSAICCRTSNLTDLPQRPVANPASRDVLSGRVALIPTEDARFHGPHAGAA